MMLRKSLAGWVSVIFRVSGLGADRPPIVWLFCQAAMFAPVSAGAGLAEKWAFSESQYEVNPAIVLW